MSEWIETLQAENVPLTCSLEFHCQNEGVRRVVMAGKQILFSEASRLFAWNFIENTKMNSFIVDTTRLDGYDFKKATKVTLHFCQGDIVGDRVFHNRKERKATLQSIWGIRKARQPVA
jgi:hypothetical protein